MGRTLTITFPDTDLFEIAAKLYSQFTGKPTIKVTQSELLRIALVEYTATLTALVEVKKPPGFWQEIWGRAKIYLGKEGFAKTIAWKDTRELWTETRSWNATMKEIAKLSKAERDKFAERRQAALDKLQERETKMLMLTADEEATEVEQRAAAVNASERA